MDFVGIFVLVINEERVVSWSDNFLRVFDEFLWELREGVVFDVLIVFLGMEVVFLVVIGILDLVGEEVGGVEKDKERFWLGIGGWVVVG